MSRRGWYWPFALAGLLLAGMGGNVALILLASGDPSFAVERDYYRKAVTWDVAMAQAERNAELGWSLAAALEPAAGGARLTVRLADRDARAIGGARVTVEAFHGARAGEIVSAPLEPRGDGRYEAVLPATRTGVWELRFRADRAAETFTAVVVRELRGRP